MLTIVFDLDGTLIDTAPDLVDTLNHVLAQRGLPVVPFNTARRLIGGGAKIMIQRALNAAGRECSAVELDALHADFVTYYAAHIADRSRPFPQLEVTLDSLTAAGHRLAVCSNKLEWLSKRLLTMLGLAERFVAICGPDTFGVQKPNPEMLLRTILRAGGESGRTIMVGDSGTDVRTARAGNVPVIAVDFGYSDVPIATLRPDRIIGSFSELPATIRDVAAEHA
jgi:phosphoglycolate phosphatase